MKIPVPLAHKTTTGNTLTMQNVEDIYPLTAAQEGMLFHSLYAPETGDYFEQLCIEITADMDTAAFRHAWEKTVERHAILRTGFVWKDVEQPLQVVHRRVEVPWHEDDWRGSIGSTRERLDAYLAEDRRTPFDLKRPPLIRFALIRTGERSHFFVLTFHHILMDGWSLAIVFKEGFTLYRALRDGVDPGLPPPQPYRNYIAWLKRRDMSEALTFWRATYAGFETPIRIELGGSGAAADIAGATHTDVSVVLDATRTEAIRTLARDVRVTVNTLVLGAWALLLGRYANETDVVIGTAVSGRPAELDGVESMVGLFLNTLPLRVDVGGDHRLDEWLRAIQMHHASMRRTEFTSLAEIQRCCNLPQGQALFESIVVFENYPVDPNLGFDDGTRGEASRVAVERFVAHTNYPLHLRAEARDRVALNITLDRRRVSEAWARQLLDQLVWLLDSFAIEPGARLGALSLAVPDAGVRLPDPRAPLDRPVCPSVPEMFLEQVVRNPDATAIEHRGEILSYRELSARADAMAERLLAAGLEPGDVVGVAGERGIEWVSAMLATLLAGGVLLTLDPLLPRARRETMVAEAGARFLVALGEVEDRPWPGVECLRLGGDRTGPDAPGLTIRRSEPVREGPAYVFFTSGTTGVPCGVLGDHQSLGHFLDWQRKTFGIVPGDRFAQLTAPSFDVVLRDVFLPLVSGATLCLPAERDLLGGAAVLRWLGASRVTALHAVPALVQDWLIDAEPSARLPDLRHTFFAGEPLTDGLVAQWRERLAPGGTIVNLYGPTETTLAKCFHVVGDEPRRGVQPVGHPLPQTQALVLGPGDRICGIGEVGEIVIRTPFRARGFVNADARTGFERNPFRPTDEGDLVYRTGDLGRYAVGGELEILGRVDRQVKVRGVRVEPSEIEAALSACPGIVGCTVVARKDAATSETTLVGYVVAEAGASLDNATLVAHLRARLPLALVPSAFVFLDRIPTTANGKVDRNALPEPVVTASLHPSTVDVQLPATDTERALAALWGRVLGAPPAERNDDFFALGGHSLLATRVISRLPEALGVELPLKAIFEHSTLAALAERIDAARESNDACQRPALERAPRGADLPLSFAQQRLWFLHQLAPTSAFYHMPSVLRLRGRLDRRALERALEALVARQETLRTSIPTRDGAPVQVIRESVAVDLPLEDLGSLAPASRWPEAQRLALAELYTPFDLARAPLMRARLLRLDEADHVLVLTLHHIVSDGWSVGVLNRELSELYRAFARSQPCTLPELPIQYADYAAWQREYLSGAILEDHIDYWTRQLGGLEPLALPTDRPRPSTPSFRGACESLDIPLDVVESLRAIGRAHGATPFMTLLAAFYVLLNRYTGQTDLVVGSPIAGRSRPEFEDLVGFFVNMLVMRVDLTGDLTFPELLQRVRDVSLGAYEHQELPFERLVDELETERDLSRNPIFQVSFAVQNAPRPALALEGLTLEPVALPFRTMRFDLEAFVWEKRDGLAVLFYYSTDLFEAETIRRMLDHYATLLRAIAARPGSLVHALPLMSDAERARVLTQWNATRTEYSRDETVSSLVARAAREHRDAVAVSQGVQSLTYAALEARANQLAQRLRREGVGTDVPVAVLMARSPAMVVAWLGAIRAGGAYLPIDPDYPDSRVAYMLADSGAPVLLTDEALRARAGGFDGCIISLDGDAQSLATEPAEAPPVRVEPHSLAYLIYTSGSTGEPKGVVVEHRGLSNLVHWHLRAHAVTYRDRATQVAALGFDASVWEVWPYLCVGASVHLVTDEDRHSPQRLWAWMADRGITLSFLPTPLAEAALRVEPPPGLALRTLLTGGDRLHGGDFRGLPFELVNHYGPTENSVVSTWGRVDPADPVPPIGWPIDNTRAYVLDTRMEPVPVGVPGELYVGGESLARGYWRRPELTRSRFVDDPFESGGRLYRTGDRVRQRDDGQIEFLGRVDTQVKVRGFRIELGEIESALVGHDSVSQAAVLCREDTPGDRRLVAYVVASPRWLSESVHGIGKGHIEEWRTLYEQTYEGEAVEERDLDIIGWNSSYTGAAIPREEMREWVEATVSRIRGLGPRRVLEVGCGTGLLLSRLAGQCERYVGTDFSGAALRRAERLLRARPDLAHVELHEGEAADLSAFASGSFDTVVLNSVVQYFSGVDYLVRALREAVRVTSPGGRIFVGDVRNLDLLDAFHAAVQVHRGETSSMEALVRLARLQRERDGELVLDPALFHGLREHEPRLGEVEVLLKQGRAMNELTQFRYDVVLHVESPESEPVARWLDWEAGGLTESTLGELLRGGDVDSLGVRGVPNARLARETALLERLAAGGDEDVRAWWRRWDGAVLERAVQPQALFELARETGYEAEVGYAASDRAGRMDVVFRRNGRSQCAGGVFFAERPRLAHRPLGAYANNPLREKLARELVPSLRAHLQERLPEYMVPSAFLVLDALPLTPNGKVDRRSLPTPEHSRAGLGEAYVAPRNETERRLAEIWQQVLRLDRVGVHDNFFELGGDSILSIQVVSRANAAGMGLTTRHMFDHQTVAELATVCDQRYMVGAEQGVVIGKVPLTPIQRWFFERELADAHHFNQALAFDLPPDVDPGALRRAASAVISHHDALRMRFRRGAHGWEQQLVAPDEDVPMWVVNLNGESRDERIERIASESVRAQSSLELESGRLLRFVLYVRGEAEPPTLLVVIHHLVVDGVSWRVLIEDLNRALGQAIAREPVRLPPKTSSFKTWAERLADVATTDRMRAQLGYWRDVLQTAAPALPRDFPDDGVPDTVGRAGHVGVSFDAEETRALVQEAPHAYRIGVENLLLTALARTIGRWIDSDEVLLALEGHGREQLFEDVDVSRTVGWFTSLYPLRLRVPRHASDGEAIKAVKEQLRAVPDRGVGYGILRFLGVASELAGANGNSTRPEISFNYLGQFDQALNAPSLLTVSRHLTGPQASPRGERAFALEVNAVVSSERLQLRWTYGTGRFREGTVRRLAEDHAAAVRALVAHCLRPDTAGYTPSDFSIPAMDQIQLDRLVNKHAQ